MKLSISNSKGFTLLELVVVLGLFMLIMGAMVTIFISIVQHQKRILSQQEMLNQITYVQDYFSRSLREVLPDTKGDCLASGGTLHPGAVYLLTHLDISSGFYQGVKFISKENGCQEFFLDTDGILKEIKPGQPKQNIVSSKFTFRYARFVINGNKNVRGATNTDAVKPRLSFALDVADTSYANPQEIIIQTTVSKR